MSAKKPRCYRCRVRMPSEGYKSCAICRKEMGDCLRLKKLCEETRAVRATRAATRICITEGCIRKVFRKDRCSCCFRRIRDAVRAGRTTWEEVNRPRERPWLSTVLSAV